jgi:hypothetical protein
VLDKTKIKHTFGLEIPYWVDSLKKCELALLAQANPITTTAIKHHIMNEIQRRRTFAIISHPDAGKNDFD